MKVDIKHTSQEYRGFFTLEKSKLQFEKFDGSMSDEVVRENFYRGDSVAAVVYDASERLVLLIQQFRYPVYTVQPENAWIWELVAGSRNRDEEPIECMLRELQEEVHVRALAHELEEVGTFFVSPGGTSERIYLYALNTNLRDLDKRQGGVQAEHEDIRIGLFAFQKVFDMLKARQIQDAKSIIGAQWLHARLQSS